MLKTGRWSQHLATVILDEVKLLSNVRIVNVIKGEAIKIRKYDFCWYMCD